ncbi:MAG: glucose-6-phosphate isomerase [Saprospirales bacterium]|nr:glucose-6-phosphate isomerase [Saprospirales bacterium]
MKSLFLDLSKTEGFLASHEMQYLAEQAESAARLLESKQGPGGEFLGWLDLPVDYNRLEFEAIREAAQQIRAQSEVLVVIGIGGSYLGAQAAITFLKHTFYNQLPAAKRGGPEIYFAGINLSGTYLQHLIELIGERDFSINVVSKSGTTTEPAIAFRLLKSLLEKRYGKEGARKRIYATTDLEKGALKQLATQEGYPTFEVPDDVGGRYSVLSAVGLLPIAAAGIDIAKLMEGAAAAESELRKPFAENACYQYAAARNALHRKGRDIEMFIYYEPRFYHLAEWWKQLYGESEGKDGKGIFTASAGFTTDLHSLGQYIQDGKRHLFETLLELENPGGTLLVEPDPDNLDGLNYLAGKSLDYVNQKAAQGTVEAHVAGGVPNLRIVLPEASPYYLGYLFYFFEKACGVSGYMLGVNPFDQPGVEAYKKNMFRLLGK